MKDRLFSMLLTIGFAVVAAVLLYPTFADYYNDVHSATVIRGYETEVGEMDSVSAEEGKERILKYNQEVAENQKRIPFTYQGASASDDTYESLLAFADGIMCYVDVPAAGIYLPVAHGTRSEILEYEAGHMYGTSIPYGGEGTHAVITGHTGLKSAKLFNGLIDVKEGDVFYIYILGEIHAYTVDRISVVLPEDEDPYLQVEDGKDYVTLYTCTPYGINDHRLLVRGARTYPDIVPEASGRSKAGFAVVRNRSVRLYVLICLTAAVPFAVLAAGLSLTFRKKKRGASGPDGDIPDNGTPP